MWKGFILKVSELPKIFHVYRIFFFAFSLVYIVFKSFLFVNIIFIDATNIIWILHNKNPIMDKLLLLYKKMNLKKKYWLFNAIQLNRILLNNKYGRFEFKHFIHFAYLVGSKIERIVLRRFARCSKNPYQITSTFYQPTF